MESNHGKPDDGGHAGGAKRKERSSSDHRTKILRIADAADPLRARILIVDDDESFGRMVESAMDKLSEFDISYATGSQQALWMMEKHPFDIVITDIRMPGTNGIELTRIIKRKYTSDVIIVTGYFRDFTYEEAIESGANDFLEKPIKPTELLLRVKRVLMERAMQERRDEAEREQRISVERLHKALGATVQALVVASEIRDPYTAGHQRRVADLSRSIAETMDLTVGQADGIRMAGTIHDLGKISVPAEILSKPTTLDDIEFALIRRHPLSGFNILKDIEFPWPVARMVLEHHERLDGSGYPNGLTADHILTESKVIAVADVVEAIASHRPYRAGLGIDTALGEIKENKGTLYDEKAADACLKLFREDGYELKT